MPLPKILNTTVFRLSTIYVAGFAASIATLGVLIYFVASAALDRRLDGRIEAEVHALTRAYRTGGLPALVAAVDADRHANGPFGYAVLENRRRVAGGLLRWPQAAGWATLPYPESDGDAGRRRFLLADLGGNVGLVIAADPEEVDEIRQAIFDATLSAFGAVTVLGILGGLALSFALLKRVEAIRRTAEAIIAGDLSRRIPLHNSGDDLDRLSETLNRMLDRIRELMESLREVSAHIAHDLKTPLAHLRQRLEGARNQAEGARELALHEAISQTDEILVTFDALLRIAQIEAGTRRAGFASLDLSELFSTVADAFAPSAEELGRWIIKRIEPGLHTIGDRELLTQMLANLVENAIRYTPAQTAIKVELFHQKGCIFGSVSDDGPGVPAEERERIFRRFHRLPESRGIPGSGLGLSLVKAVADIHAVTLAAEDAEPGLRVTMRFPTENERTHARRRIE